MRINIRIGIGICNMETNPCVGSIIYFRERDTFNNHVCATAIIGGDVYLAIREFFPNFIYGLCHFLFHTCPHELSSGAMAIIRVPSTISTGSVTNSVFRFSFSIRTTKSSWTETPCAVAADRMDSALCWPLFIAMDVSLTNTFTTSGCWGWSGSFCSGCAVTRFLLAI